MADGILPGRLLVVLDRAVGRDDLRGPPRPVVSRINPGYVNRTRPSQVPGARVGGYFLAVCFLRSAQ